MFNTQLLSHLLELRPTEKMLSSVVVDFTRLLAITLSTRVKNRSKRPFISCHGKRLFDVQATLTLPFRFVLYVTENVSEPHLIGIGQWPTDQSL